MKKTSTIPIVLFVLFLSTLIFSSGCTKDLEEILLNEDPTCEITSPQDGQLIPQGEEVTISVIATDSDGSILRVSFFIDDVLKDSSYSAPYTFVWQTKDENIGTHTIKAMSRDDLGFSTTSQVDVEIM